LLWEDLESKNDRFSVVFGRVGTGWSMFERQKAVILEEVFGGGGKDRSPKGGLDAGIVSVLEELNGRREYVSTSSCSGRVSLFFEDDDDSAVPRKGGGRWLAVDHELSLDARVVSSLLEGLEKGQAVMKVEPAVLHVMCRTSEDAQRLLAVAREAGFRESGISLGHKKVVLAIRTSSNCLEVPIWSNGEFLCTKPGLERLCEIAAAKFHAVVERREKLERAIRAMPKQHAEARLISSSRLFQTISLSWQPFRELTFQRWGHSATALDDGETIVVFGGFGPLDKVHQRLNNVQVFHFSSDGQLFEKVLSVDGVAPANRTRHSATLFSKNRIFVFGGRESPFSPLNDFHVLMADDKNGFSWMSDLTVEGSVPAPRWGHTCVRINSEKAFIFGGRSENGFFGDCFEVTFAGNTVKFERIETLNAPCARYGHSLTAVAGGTKLVLFGGYASLHTDSGNAPVVGDAHVLDLASKTWECVVPHTIYHARFSHQAVKLSDSTILIVGGTSMVHKNNGTRVLDLLNRCYHPLKADESYGLKMSPSLMLQKFSLVEVADRFIVALGGGALCFSFGSCFSNSAWTDIFHLRNHHFLPDSVEVHQKRAKTLRQKLEKFGFYDSKRKIVPSGPKHVAIPVKENFSLRAVGEGEEPLFHIQAPCPSSPVARAEVPESNTDEQPSRNIQAVKDAAVLVSAKECKNSRVKLEQMGLYDPSRRIAPLPEFGGKMGIPVLQQHKGLDDFLSHSSFEIVEVELPTAKASRQKLKSIQEEILRFLQRTSSLLPEEAILKKEIPKRIEIFGDVAILPKEAFRSREKWSGFLGQHLWQFIAKLTRTKRVIWQVEIDKGGKRKSRASLIYPEGGKSVVQVKQNGIWYKFDLEKCMFSSGNISEKQRVANFNCMGETVVDLFAGIGYFTLPYLVKSGAAIAHACEWNEDAIEALKENLVLNGIAADRCKLHFGDCREAGLENLADRVNLGLIPTSEPYWETAVKALRKDSGGWLHIHDNVPQERIETWKQEMSEKIFKLLPPGWNVSCHHVEKVKSYSPRVLHIVADVICRPSQLNCNDEEELEKPFVKKFHANLSFWSNLESFIKQNEEMAQKKVSVHVSDSKQLDFVTKSFRFEVLPFMDFIQRVHQEISYLRAVGKNPRKERAHFWKDFAPIAAASGFQFPCSLVPRERYFSSVLRIASPGLQLWTHYDTMDNVLFHFAGKKRVLLFRPEDIPEIMMHGCASAILDVDTDERIKSARENALEFVLEPGDALFIPALWPHNVTTVGDQPSVSVNIFWRPKGVDELRKDLYGNVDPPQVKQAQDLIHQARQLLSNHIKNDRIRTIYWNNLTKNAP